MKGLLSVIVIFSITVLISCSDKNTQLVEESSSVILISYEINTPSKIWIKDLKDGEIHEAIISKQRREPKIKLNDTVEVTYYKDASKKIMNISTNIHRFDKIPDDSLNKIVSLENYYKIYRK